MQPIDPFAAPATATTYGLPTHGGVQVYPDGYFRPVTSFDLSRMLTAPFKSPNWLMNLLWMFVCHLGSIIVIGNLVLFGYLAEVAESRSGGRSENWPDFNPDRFSEYLMRGLWPFLWSLIWTIPLLMLVGIPVCTTVALSSFLMQNNNETSGIIVMVIGGIVSMVLYCFAMLAMMASMIHSGLGNDFQKGADVKWIKSYVSTMGLTTVWVGIVFVLVGTVVNTLGFMFFCVGILFTPPILNLMAADLCSQLHDIFVSRGGLSAFPPTQMDTNMVDAKVVV